LYIPLVCHIPSSWFLLSTWRRDPCCPIPPFSGTLRFQKLLFVTQHAHASLLFILPCLTQSPHLFFPSLPFAAPNEKVRARGLLCYMARKGRLPGLCVKRREPSRGDDPPGVQGIDAVPLQENQGTYLWGTHICTGAEHERAALNLQMSQRCKERGRAELVWSLDRQGEACARL